MKNVIFIAPPAAGKGSISSYLENNLGYVHVSTGDILRNVSRENTEMGRNVASLMKDGKFIGDDIILPLFREELLKIKDKPFILDGMPRNLEQANYLDNLFKELYLDNYVVIHLTVPSELLEKRAVGRRVCKNCGSTYNIYFDEFKPKVEDTCDQCNEKLIQREDDTSLTFKKRYQIYLDSTLPLIEFYKKKNLLTCVDVHRSKEEIIKDVIFILKGEEND